VESERWMMYDVFVTCFCPGHSWRGGFPDGASLLYGVEMQDLLGCRSVFDVIDHGFWTCTFRSRDALVTCGGHGGSSVDFPCFETCFEQVLRLDYMTFAESGGDGRRLLHHCRRACCKKMLFIAQSRNLSMKAYSAKIDDMI
jgi:hypothetical protein